MRVIEIFSFSPTRRHNYHNSSHLIGDYLIIVLHCRIATFKFFCPLFHRFWRHSDLYFIQANPIYPGLYEFF